MSIRGEAEYAARLRTAVIDALNVHGRDGLPVLPLLEIVLSYLVPFQCVVTTEFVGQDDALQFPVVLHGVYGRSQTSSAPARLKSLLIGDQTLVRELDLESGTATIIAGRNMPSEPTSMVDGPARGIELHAPSGIAIDPLNSNRIYISDIFAIRVYERPAKEDVSGRLSLLAGPSTSNIGYANATGTNAKFSGIRDLCIVPDGTQLIATDFNNHRLRGIDTKTGAVTTLVGDGRDDNKSGFGTLARVDHPKCMAWDTSTPEPFPALFVTSYCGFIRFDLKTKEVRAYTELPAECHPYGIAGLRDGRIVFSCNNTHSLYLYDPATAAIDLLAGFGFGVGVGWLPPSSAQVAHQLPGVHTNEPAQAPPTPLGFAAGDQFNRPAGLHLVAADESVFVADESGSCVRRVSLPPFLFASPAS